MLQTVNEDIGTSLKDLKQMEEEQKKEHAELAE